MKGLPFSFYPLDWLLGNIVVYVTEYRQFFWTRNYYNAIFATLANLVFFNVVDEV